jgi:hypothetical protein
MERLINDDNKIQTLTYLHCKARKHLCKRHTQYRDRKEQENKERQRQIDRDGDRDRRKKFDDDKIKTITSCLHCLTMKHL